MWFLFLIGVIEKVVVSPSGDTMIARIPETNLFHAEVQVAVKETLWNDSTRFLYRYTVINADTSQQSIIRFEIPDAILDTRRYPNVQVPYYSRGDTAYVEYQTGWSGWPSVVHDLPTWSVDISPGETTILVFVTRELPDISFWNAEGRDSLTIPEYIAPSEDQAEDLNEEFGFPLYYALTPFGPGKYGRTVGPGPLPPSTPDSMFLHFLERVEVGHDLGWMSERAFRRLDSMIRHAYTQSYNFTAFDPVRGARNMNQIVRTIERLHNQGEIEDRAFYVLYYRARYIHQKFQEMIPQGKE